VAQLTTIRFKKRQQLTC